MNQAVETLVQEFSHSREESTSHAEYDNSQEQRSSPLSRVPHPIELVERITEWVNKDPHNQRKVQWGGVAVLVVFLLLSMMVRRRQHFVTWGKSIADFIFS